MRFLLEYLSEPLLKNVDIDGSDRIHTHMSVLARKRMLQEVFVDFHHRFRKLDQQFLQGNGLAIELGSGVAPMRNSYPSVLATDVLDSPHLDRTIDAENMDLENDSVRVLYCQNCFHHFPHPDRFFQELKRVLVPGGGAILLEPYFGPLASFLYRRLFRTEGFDPSYPSWETPATGPMNGANQALSYIVFIRDREIFRERYPFLSIVYQEQVNNYLRYLLSGGLNFRQLVPEVLAPVLSMVEKALSPFNRWCALHHIIVLKKNNSVPR